jgi:hypothetical protein
MNGHSESFVGTLKRECLDHFAISSTDHMDRLCQRYAEFYNTVRPHRALDNGTIEPRGTASCQAPPPRRKTSPASRGWAGCSGIIPRKARRETWAQIQTQVLWRNGRYTIVNIRHLQRFY